jgi:pyruvate dehydrogenase E2 component (dihydrolipoamide acetyltransferase)
MATKIYLPRLGESIEEATISRYLKKIGDKIQRGDIIAELETAKAMMELESPARGTLLAIFPEEGETIDRGTLVAVIGQPGENWKDDPLPVAPPKENDNDFSVRDEVISQTQASSGKLSRRINISPNAKRIALEKGVDLDQLAKSFPDKRITSEDVTSFLQESGTEESHGLPVKKIELNKMQSLTAKRMIQSAAEIPQFSVSIEVDAKHLLEQNENYKTKGINITITAQLIATTAKTLQKLRRLNSRYDNGFVLEYQEINIAVAMATEEGLVSPVIRQADTLELSEITKKLAELRQKVENHRLMMHDLENGTFTISNLGMLGARAFVPMVTPNQSAILGVGEIYETYQPESDNLFTSRQKMILTLSADHRVVGGAECAMFLKTLKDIIENK